MEWDSETQENSIQPRPARRGVGTMEMVGIAILLSLGLGLGFILTSTSNNAPAPNPGHMIMAPVPGYATLPSPIEESPTVSPTPVESDVPVTPVIPAIPEVADVEQRSSSPIANPAIQEIAEILETPELGCLIMFDQSYSGTDQ